jgi:hypothetical protein
MKGTRGTERETKGTNRTRGINEGHDDRRREGKRERHINGWPRT